MKKIILAISLFVLFCFSTVGQSVDEEQIKQVISKLSLMWTDKNGIELADQITAANVLFFTPEGSLNKKQYIQVLSNLFTNGQNGKVSHEIVKMKILKHEAYEYGILRMELPNGTIQTFEICNIFVKEKGEWKYFGVVPVDVMKELFGK